MIERAVCINTTTDATFENYLFSYRKKSLQIFTASYLNTNSLLQINIGYLFLHFWNRKYNRLVTTYKSSKGMVGIKYYLILEFKLLY